MTDAKIAALPYRPCVGVVLLNKDGDVFAGQRIDNTAEAWQMPQGGIDPGESPRATALRELTEETGIRPELVEVLAETPEWIRYDLPDDLVPKIWNGQFRGQTQLWYLMRFLGEDTDVNIRTVHAEFRSWRWIKPHVLIDMIVPFKRATYTTVFEAFRDSLRPPGA